MRADEIRMVIEWFRQGAVRAQRAGSDGIQIHAAHFFFLSRFISPAVNHRSDEYGGSALKRARILKEIRGAVPSGHVSVKINCTDGMPGGLTENDALEICVMPAENGLDSIEVSGNGTSVPGIRPYIDEGYFAPFGKSPQLQQMCRSWQSGACAARRLWGALFIPTRLLPYPVTASYPEAGPAGENAQRAADRICMHFLQQVLRRALSPVHFSVGAVYAAGNPYSY